MDGTRCSKPGFGAAGGNIGTCTLDTDGVEGKVAAARETNYPTSASQLVTCSS